MQLLLSLLETEPEEDASTIWKGQSAERRAEALAVLARLIAKAVEAPTGPDESKELGDE
jgi:hypothetical protein